MNSIIIDKLLHAGEYVLMAGILFVVFSIGKNGLDRDIKQDLKKRLIKGALIIAVFAFANGYIFFGTSSDCSEADPIRGGCETTEEFTPTSTERFAQASYLFVLLTVPYLWGGYAKHKEMKEAENEREKKA